MSGDIETPSTAPDTFVEKVSAFGEFPETALREINQQDIDAFKPGEDTPALNPFERSRVHENTNKLLQFLEADQARGQQHANALGALRQLRTQLDKQAIYNTPVLEHAAKHPRITAVLGTVGVLAFAKWLTGKNEEKKRGFVVKTLAVLGIVGLAAWLLSNFGKGPGLGKGKGLGLGKNGEKPKKKPADTVRRPEEIKNTNPTVYIWGKRSKKTGLIDKYTTTNTIQIGSTNVIYDTEHNDQEDDSRRKNIKDVLRTYILAFRRSIGAGYKPENHKLTIYTDSLTTYASAVDDVRLAARQLAAEFPECKHLSVHDYYRPSTTKPNSSSE
jgi:hypothetical protein